MEERQEKKVLIIDDNHSIRSAVVSYLSEKGFLVEEASDGIEGLEKGLTETPDITLLDVVMPGMDGFTLCRMLREKGVTTPIIMLTEKATIEDKITGFSGGADDYLPKPFNLVELELRINALLKRHAEERATTEEPAKIEYAGLEIDLERHKVTLNGKEVILTPIEFSILKLLASRPGFVYARDDLLNAIWQTSYEGYKRNIDPHVNRLRMKIEENPRKPKYVLTVWGVGYKFNDALK